MKVFAIQKDNITAVAVAFNRGHAVKMLAKELEIHNINIDKSDLVQEIDLETKRGSVTILANREQQ